MLTKTTFHLAHRALLGLALLAVTTIFSGCGVTSHRTIMANDRDILGQHYRQYHDYESLVALIPSLNTYRMRRVDVEHVLGQPTYCPAQETCWYKTDRSIAAACGEGTVLSDNTCRFASSGEEIPPLQFALVLLVNYEPGNPGSSLAETSPRLIGFLLTPVGE